MSESSGESRSPKWLDALLVLACLTIALGWLFRDSLDRGQVLFANDYPLAAIQSHAFDEQKDPWSFWQDQNWLGGEIPSATPSFTLMWIRLCLWAGGDQGAVLFAKTYAPMALLLLGFSSWLLFRSLRFSQPVCVLGALALALNGDLLTHATWGLPSVALGAAGACLCLAAVFHGLRQNGWRVWAWTALGGLALGQGVMESFDVGGIFSLCVAGVVFVAILNRDGQKTKQLAPNALRGTATVAVVALAAALMAGHTLVNLFQTAGGAAAAMKASPVKRLEQSMNEYRDQVEAVTGKNRRLVNAATDLDVFKKQQLLAQIDRDRQLALNEIERNRQSELKQIEQQQFDAATQFGLPPGETLRMAIPGLYGYYMKPHGWMNLPVDDAELYWGALGQEPAYTRVLALNPRSHNNALQEYQRVTRQPGPGMKRWAYCGVYAGWLVLLVAAWALAQSARAEGVYSPAERRWIWVWTVGALGCLLLSWGQHAPFYQLIYKLPFFDTIRNPIKFVHPLSVALVVLFAYGLEGLSRAYLAGLPTRQPVRLWFAGLRSWDRRWLYGMGAVLLVAGFAWAIFATARPDLRLYLADSLDFNPETATAMSSHSVWAASVALWVLGLASGWVVWVMTGKNRSALWLAGGLLLCADLGRGSAPYIVHFNHITQYAPNDIVRILSQRPYEQRIHFLRNIWQRERQVIERQHQQLISKDENTADVLLKKQLALDIQNLLMQYQQLINLANVYQTDWKQGLFPWNHLHTVDVIQEPRVVPENAAYRQALAKDHRRFLELTSTRWLLGGSVSIMPHLPGAFSTHTNAFTLRESFNLIARAGPTNAPPRFDAVATLEGLLALVEFEDALPRAGVYSHWRSEVTDEAALALLPDPEWDPHREVLVAEDLPAPDSVDTNAMVIPARYEFYDPKRVVISTDAESSTVLMLNDKHHPAWQVTVDGKPAKLLRANYLMRGVHLSPGKHTVEFKFAPAAGSIRISLAGLGLAGVLGALLIFMPSRRRDDDDDALEEVDLEITIPSDDPETPTVAETSSRDEPPVPSRQKSPSRSGRRRKH